MASVPPNMLASFWQWIRSVNPRTLGLILDFDGTISELVLVPTDAAMHPDVVRPLTSLTSKLGLTAVMSGREARDVQRRVAIDDIFFVGSHGIEYISGGKLTQVQQAEDLPISPQALLDRLKPIADGPGIVWGVKAFSLTIHYRMSPDKDKAVQGLYQAIESVPEIRDMEVMSGNMILEIRGKDAVNKGTAIEKIAREHELETLMFLGDDTTDVDALRALRELGKSGAINGIGVAVIQSGTPPAVLELSDYSLDGVAEVAKFLAMLDEATA